MNKIKSIVEFCEPLSKSSPNNSNPFHLFPSQMLALKCYYNNTPGNENVVLSTNECLLGNNLGFVPFSGFTYRELLLIWGRRTGKTLMMNIMALYELYRLLNFPEEMGLNKVVQSEINPITILMLTCSTADSKLQKTSFEHYKRILIPEISNSGTNTYVNGKNKVRVQITTPQNEISYLGIPCYFVGFSELASMKVECQSKIQSLSPLLWSYPYSSLVCMSTPRKTGDLLHEMYLDQSSKKLQIKAATWQINIAHTKDALRESESHMNEASFAREYGADFGEQFETEQVTFRLEKWLIERAKKIARKRSYEENTDILYTDIMRDILTNTVKQINI